jgi:hypothetical protein
VSQESVQGHLGQESVEFDAVMSTLGDVTGRNVALGAMAFTAAIVMLAVAAKYK